MNTSWFVALAQSLVHLLAVLFFFHVYSRSFQRFLIPVAVVLTGYLTAGMTLHFDTVLLPDSLLGSTYIACTALVMHAMLKRHWWPIPVYIMITVFSISMRPSGLVLIPPLLLFFGYQLLVQHRWKSVLVQLCFAAVCLSGLAAFNGVAGPYQKFSIITKPVIPDEAREQMVLRTLEDDLLQELARLVPHTDITSAARFPKVTDSDSLFNLYLTKVLRPVTIGYGRIDKDTVLYFTNSNTISMDLDSVALEIGADLSAYADFRERFISEFNDSRVMFRSERGWKYIRIHLTRFFWYFHTDRIADYPMDFRDFYGSLLWHRLVNFRVHDIWQSFSRRDHRLVGIEGVTRRIAKELAFDTPLTMAEAEAQYEPVTGSVLYRYVLAPYYALHPYLFRNAAYPWVFLLFTLLSTFGFLRSGMRSPLFLLGIMGAGILLGTLFIHVVYRTSIYWRYTYQISFFYYFAVVMIPPVVSALLNPATETETLE